MTPGARAQAAIELLDRIVRSAAEAGPAADSILYRYFRERRYAGSGDRRAVRELVFRVVRALGERPPSGRAALLGYADAFEPTLLPLFGAGGHAPAAREPGEPVATPGLAPAWIADRLAPVFGPALEAELEALAGRAPLDLRVNRLKADVPTVRAKLPDAAPVALPPPLPSVPDALRIDPPRPLEREPAYVEGLVEVQDVGSQLAVGFCGARPGEQVVDLCAGAGGKSLALAAIMANAGRILACDVDRKRLDEAPPRLARAGAGIVETRLLDGGREAAGLSDLLGQADLVLVDAPCSGSGTWRRSPEARWRLTPERLSRLVAVQARLLALGATLVRPGGRLVYVVCSLLPEETRNVAEQFLQQHAAWRARSEADGGPSLLLTPRQHATDGFFAAAFVHMLYPQ